jgi:glycosyltransferase involved in cell wall biosynthesis
VNGLTVTVITWNEEERLRPCLESVAWAQEIVVVDAESTDKTVEIAREFTDRIWVRPWPGFSLQKNFALEQVKTEWVLSLDADERVTPELREEIERVIGNDGPADGYTIPRKNFFWGAWVRHGRLYPDRQLRLFRRDRGRFAELGVHESVEIDGGMNRLASALVHQSYRSLSEFVQRSNHYSTLAAQEWLKRGKRVGMGDLMLRPLWRFLSMFLLHRGFLDGWRGLVLAVLYAHYVFLRTAKVWETQPRLADD